jgi:hypothetical protein
MSRGSPSTDTQPNSLSHATAWRRTALIAGLLALIAVLLVSSIFGAVATPTRSAGLAAAPHGTIFAAASAHPAAKHPVVPGVTPPTAPGPVFYQNTSAHTSTFSSSSPCVSAWYQNCPEQASQPSLLPLGPGLLGLTYAVGTANANDVCNGTASAQTASRIAFTTSTDNGSSWATGSLIGQTNASCPYFQQFEPSFTVNASGGIVGAYVGANVTAQRLSAPSTSGLCCPASGIYSNYTNRSSDALIFANSSDQGGSFNETIVRAAGANIADPKIATYGNTIYIVYENVSNTSLATPQALPGTWLYSTTNYAISVWMIVSTDGGTVWGNPIPLPGENASQFNSSMSPTISVSSTGEIAVSYLTNRSCIAYCSAPTYGPEYGDDVVVVTSTSNGSAWSPIETVYSGSGESTYYGYNELFGYYDSLEHLFQYASAPVLAWNAAGTQLYVAWSGSYNLSNPETALYANLYGENFDWEYPGIFASTSTNGGTSWTTTLITGHQRYDTLNTYLVPSFYLDPGITVQNGEVYVSYFSLNQSSSGGGAVCGLSGGASSPLVGAAVEFLASSPNGVTWSGSSVLDFQPSVYYIYSYLGTTSSVAIVNGSAVAAFTMPNGGYVYPSFPNDIHVATPYVGATVNVTFNTTPALAAGATQYFGVEFQTYSMGNAGLTVTGVPSGLPVAINVSQAGTAPAGFIEVPTGGGGYTFFANQNVTFGEEFYTFVNITMEPVIYYYEVEDFNSNFGTSMYSFLEDYYSTYPTPSWHTYSYATCLSQYGYSMLIPAYTNVTVGYENFTSDIYIYADTYFYFTPSLVIGSGPGNYTGTSDNFTINASGPINETYSYYPAGSYTVDVAAPSLPTNTPFRFDWNGQPESSATGAPVAIQNVSTGYYYVTNITANGSQAGWVYTGTPAPANPIAVPRSTTVDLNFAYLNASAPAGRVSFYAGALTTGTVWQLSFNGTTYSSATPWINVTVHPGTYPIYGFPVTSQNSSATYVPTGLGPSIAVNTSSTYDVSFVPAYKVTAIASGGGTTTSPGSTWVASGTTASFTAAPLTGFSWIGWTGSGPGSYSGSDLTANVTANGPILETANFAPLPANRFTLTVNETGVPNGTTWTVQIDGVGYSSNSSSLAIPDLYSCSAPAAESTYHLYVPDAYAGGGTNQTRYVPQTYGTSFCVRSSPVNLVFSTQYYLSLTASTGGSIEAAVGSGGFAGSTWAPALSTVSLKELPSTGYSFVAWQGMGPGNYSGTDPTPNFALSGAITESATFSQNPPPPPPPRYNETFLLTAPLATGTVWGVTLTGAGNTTTFTSTGTSLNATGLLAGTYSVTVSPVYSPDHRTQYQGPALFSLPIHANGQRTIAFATAYWVTIAATGPGSVAGAGSKWVPAGTELVLGAVPGVGAEFLGWTGTGTGAYSGTNANETVAVSAPITETAGFAVKPVPPSTTSTVSVWSSPAAIAGLALVGLVVGLVAGLLLARGRRRSPPGPMTPAPVGEESATPPPTETGPGGSP